jgi:hypothetical protein
MQNERLGTGTPSFATQRGAGGKRPLTRAVSKMPTIAFGNGSSALFVCK